MNRRTFLHSLSASVVLTKLGLLKPKPASLIIKTGTGTVLTVDANQNRSISPGQAMFTSTPTGECGHWYRLYVGNEKRPWAP